MAIAFVERVSYDKGDDLQVLYTIKKCSLWLKSTDTGIDFVQMGSHCVLGYDLLASHSNLNNIISPSNIMLNSTTIITNFSAE